MPELVIGTMYSFTKNVNMRYGGGIVSLGSTWVEYRGFDNASQLHVFMVLQPDTSLSGEDVAIDQSGLEKIAERIVLALYIDQKVSAGPDRVVHVNGVVRFKDNTWELIHIFSQKRISGRRLRLIAGTIINLE